MREGRRSWVIVGIVGLALCAVSDLADAQKLKLSAVGTGARSRGMGKAFLAVSDDATGISWNPAGLVALERPEMSIVALGSFYKNDIKVSTGQGRSASKSYGYLDFASLVYPKAVNGRNYVFGVAFQRQSDLAWRGESVVGGRTNVADIKGGVYAISPAFAAQVHPKFWIGMSLNVQRSVIDLNITQNGVDAGSAKATTDWGKARTLNLGAMIDADKSRIGFVLRPRLGGDESLPLTVGGGISVRPNDALTIAGDVEFAKWKDFDTAYGGGLGNTVDVRIGFEYVKKTAFGGVPIRAGVFAAQAPQRQATGPNSFGSVPTAKNLTVGIGAAMKKASINLAYELSLDKSTDVTTFTLESDAKFHRLVVSTVIYLK